MIDTRDKLHGVKISDWLAMPIEVFSVPEYARRQIYRDLTSSGIVDSDEWGAVCCIEVDRDKHGTFYWQSGWELEHYENIPASSIQGLENISFKTHCLVSVVAPKGFRLHVRGKILDHRSLDDEKDLYLAVRRYGRCISPRLTKA